MKDPVRPVSTVARALALLLVTAGLLGGCAATPAEKSTAHDPFERMNRATYKFNSAVDRVVLKPVAKLYRDYVPEFMRTGIGNFLDNLGYPTVIVNDLLQGKIVDGVKDTGRLLLNSTLGLGGLLDPATTVGLDKNDEDFGQTLGKWGVPAGPYLVIPLLGPSTVRDTPTRYVDAQTSAVQLLDDEIELFDENGFVYGVAALSVLDTRAGLLSLESVLERTFDEYAFVRDSWLRRREYLVTDGEVPDEEPIEEFPMEDEETPDADAPAAEPPTAQEPATPQENAGESPKEEKEEDAEEPKPE